MIIWICFSFLKHSKHESVSCDDDTGLSCNLIGVCFNFKVFPAWYCSYFCISKAGRNFFCSKNINILIHMIPTVHTLDSVANIMLWIWNLVFAFQICRYHMSLTIFWTIIGCESTISGAKLLTRLSDAIFRPATCCSKNHLSFTLSAWHGNDTF